MRDEPREAERVVKERLKLVGGQLGERPVGGPEECELAAPARQRGYPSPADRAREGRERPGAAAFSRTAPSTSGTRRGPGRGAGGVGSTVSAGSGSPNGASGRSRDPDREARAARA